MGGLFCTSTEIFIIIVTNHMAVGILYRGCSKNIKIEAVFTKTEMKNEWTINFLQNSPLNIQHTYTSEFSISHRTSETPFLIKVSCCFVIFLLMSFPFFNLLALKCIFIWRNKKSRMKQSLMNVESVALSLEAVSSLIFFFFLQIAPDLSQHPHTLLFYKFKKDLNMYSGYYFIRLLSQQRLK